MISCSHQEEDHDWVGVNAVRSTVSTSRSLFNLLLYDTVADPGGAEGAMAPPPAL